MRSHDNKKSKVQFLSPQWSYRKRWPSWHYRQRNESSPLEGMTRYQQVNIHKLRPCLSDGSPRRSQSRSNTINIFTNSYIGRHQSIVFSREISNLWFDKYHVTINRGYSRNSLFIFTLSNATSQIRCLKLYDNDNDYRGDLTSWLRPCNWLVLKTWEQPIDCKVDV